MAARLGECGGGKKGCCSEKVEFWTTAEADSSE